MTSKSRKRLILSATVILICCFLATSIKIFYRETATGLILQEDTTALASPDAIRVAVWNLEWFPSGHPLQAGETPDYQNEYKRIDFVARFARREGCDVLICEEMRDQETCQKLVDNEALKGWHVNACSAFPLTFGIPTHQNAILSMFQTIDSGIVPWRRHKGTAPLRGPVWAVLDTGNSLTAVVGVHLKSNYISEKEKAPQIEEAKNRRKREESAKQLVQFANSLLGRQYIDKTVADVIIGGDFNTWSGDERFTTESTMKIMSDAGYIDTHASLPEAERYTMPRSKFYLPTIYDYLWHKGMHETSSPSVAQKQYTSDHCMVVAMLSLTKADSAKISDGQLEPPTASSTLGDSTTELIDMFEE